jgi:mRNA interferase ChpB
MHTTHLRKVGGSVMLAVPSALLALLGLKASAAVGIAVDGSAHGRKQRGHRPVLIVSPTAFNVITRLPVIAGIKTTGIVRCDQPCVLDIAERRGRLVETVPQDILAEVLAKPATLFE